MSHEIEPQNKTQPAIDLEALLDSMEFVEYKAARGRKGIATALLQDLENNRAVEVYLHPDKNIVAQLRERGLYAYTSMGALTNSINKRATIKVLKVLKSTQDQQLRKYIIAKA
jgi:hypothetical protein